MLFIHAHYNLTDKQISHMFSISGNVFYIRHIIIVVYCYSLLEC